MAKLVFILSALLVLQACVEPALSAGLHPTDMTSKPNDKTEEAGPTLNSQPRGLTEGTNNNDGISSQGQRQKRFYNFNFGFSPYSPFDPTYVKRDNTQDTGVYGTEDSLSQILKRVQDILIFTRRQALSPQPASHVPSYIPVFYIPQFGCGCTSDNNQGPSNDEGSNNEVPLPPHTTPNTFSTINPTPAMPTTINNKPVNPLPTDETTTPDFSSRLPEMDNEYDDQDGVRPISFEPVKPKRPLSRPPPPVDHGSSQAGNGQGDSSKKDFQPKQDAPVTTFRPPSTINRVPAQPDLPTNAIPTLCDGAVITCCHRPEVTYECFVSQGCPDPIPSDNPCDANVILNVVRKFQYYYTNRNVSNKL